MPPELDIEQVKAILTASDLIASWQVLTEEETAHRTLYRIRCRLLSAAHQLEIRFIQTEDEAIYSYQLFADRPIIRWDNAPHFPVLQGSCGVRPDYGLIFFLPDEPPCLRPVRPDPAHT